MADAPPPLRLAQAMTTDDPAFRLRQPRIVDIRHERASLPRRAWRRLARVCGAVIWRHRLASFGRNSSLRRPMLVSGGLAISIGEYVSIWPGARLEAINVEPDVVRLRIGAGTVIHPHVHIGAIESVRIGRGVLIASGVHITDHDHDWSDPSQPVIANRRAVADPVEIRDHAWLGQGVTVLKGVRIGEGSIIGAGSVVTQNVPPHCVAVGAPARVIRTYDEHLREWRKVAA